MDTIIAASASCKVRAVICFLHTGQIAAEIHCQLCRVYGDDNIMSDSLEVDPKQMAQDAH
jgi:hypothetical protein